MPQAVYAPGIPRSRGVVDAATATDPTASSTVSPNPTSMTTFTACRSAAVTAGLLLIVGGCSDSLPSSIPAAEQEDPQFGVSYQAKAAVRPNLHPDAASPGMTLRDIYSDIARRVPGGFGGLFFDGDGVLNVLLVDEERWPEARLELEAEPIIQARVHTNGRTDFDLATARVAKATWPHDRLHEWLDELLIEMRAQGRTATLSGVRVHDNAVYLGMGSAADRTTAFEIADRLSIPAGALIVEVVGKSVPLQATLHSRIRPVPGGVQIAYGSSVCTMGPNIVRSPAGHPDEHGFLVASHCSHTPFQPFDSTNVTFYEQPYIAPFQSVSYYRIGNKGIDTPLFPCVEDPNGCRNSDAATALYHTYASGDTARIARPVGRNNNTFTIDSSTPRFDMVPYMWEWVTDGEIVEKVGRSTGWTGGEVVDGCFTVKVDNPPPGYSIRCAMLVDAEAGAGDSGGPVFTITNDPQVEIVGTVFAGVPTGPTCPGGPDPLFPSRWIAYCPRFAASNLGGIFLDLDPLGIEPISFY